MQCSTCKALLSRAVAFSLRALVWVGVCATVMLGVVVPAVEGVAPVFDRDRPGEVCRTTTTSHDVHVLLVLKSCRLSNEGLACMPAFA